MNISHLSFLWDLSCKTGFTKDTYCNLFAYFIMNLVARTPRTLRISNQQRIQIAKAFKFPSFFKTSG